MRRVLIAVLSGVALVACTQNPTGDSAGGPAFRVDPKWPQALPEEGGVQLVFGQVAGIAVDDRTGHVWAIHRPSTLLADEVDKSGKPVTHR